ncbi:tannase/feruloyl esterase family alpha/beta hydrolase [Variovorax terrae]|uniref:Tannase/feruloyl esterase family alpha/beta hydrolase n=1 Tax=Variovorax terrae TaxID=2923278 RepID=A0A9X2AQ40_9BURK|nr:tannase/feruloyl esterase family alpha/beta hydrolase [Variovorax terrae]MCJ0762741.1 tannase/feruloyl esterase family alpha/beta hydrolase [Variovorax terrae]
MRPHTAPSCLRFALLASALLALAGCAGTGGPARLPATPAQAVLACDALAARFSHPQTRLVSAERVAAGQLRLPGIAEPMPEHCVVKGLMNERIGPVDGKPYAIGFEMRLPTAWNGRFFYQANGGLDGFQTPAYGDILGGGPSSNGLLKGFAVISSDAGHAFDRSTPIGGATFGLDPQARLDYGYNAVAQLTPMAKALIQAYYGKRPDRSYLVGTSNGGRHGLVAASRLPQAYDGILVSTPGYNLPRAAVAQVWGAQQFAAIARQNPATQRPDLRSALSPADLALLAQRILARCDALDGLADGIVADLAGCQAAFSVERDVPACNAGATPNGQCLSGAQKATLARVFAGPVDTAGTRLYSGLAWDPGVAGRDWATWKFESSVGPRDAIALAFVMTTPPASPAVVTGQGNSLIDYALGFPLDQALAKISATDGRYRESALGFMTPPDPTLRDFVAHGGKLIAFHGAADPVFSVLDTLRWYDGLRAAHGSAAERQARLYLVPGMNHSRGGPATDQVDMVDALVKWVEQGQAPEALVAHARGAGSAVPNPEVPADWSPTRTRLLCPHPQVARYQGGDAEQAASFRCTAP